MQVIKIDELLKDMMSSDKVDMDWEKTKVDFLNLRQDTLAMLEDAGAVAAALLGKHVGYDDPFVQRLHRIRAAAAYAHIMHQRMQDDR